MRILIDECLDWRLCRSLPDHECTSVAQRGWSGLTNGSLLGKAQNEFDVFITGDSNLQFQQNVSRFNIAIVILTAKSNPLDIVEGINSGARHYVTKPFKVAELLGRVEKLLR